jgi:hypothetical protein
MSTIKIRRVPSHLPHAHLYLDDVEEICKILLDAVCKASEGRVIYAPPGYEGPSIRYSIGDDLEMDSIADLKEHGGSARKFKIEVRVPLTASWMIFDVFASPTVELGFLGEAEQWGVYSRIKAVFEPRKYILRSAITELPEWLNMSLLFIVGMGTSFALIFPLVYLKAHPHAHGPAYIVLGWATLLGMIAFITLRPSRVSFVYSRERNKFSLENRKRWIERIVLMLLSAIVGALASRWLK